MPIYTDLNVRLPEVNSSDITVINDSQAIKQSLIRLTTIEEGEIYNFREYGLALKRYVHYPLIQSTADEIESHIKTKIARFETRVSIRDDLTTMVADYDNNIIEISIAVQIISTGELYLIPPVAVQMIG